MPVTAGDMFRLQTPGGGGYGLPKEKVINVKSIQKSGLSYEGMAFRIFFGGGGRSCGNFFYILHHYFFLDTG